MTSLILKSLLFALLASPALCATISDYSEKSTGSTSLTAPGISDWSLIGVASRPKVEKYTISGDAGKLQAKVSIDPSLGVFVASSVQNGELEEYEPNKWRVKAGTKSTTHHISDLLEQFASEHATGGVKHFIYISILEEKTAPQLQSIKAGLHKAGTPEFSAIQKTNLGKGIMEKAKFGSGDVKSVYLASPLDAPTLVFNYVDVAAPAAAAAAGGSTSGTAAGGSSGAAAGHQKPVAGGSGSATAEAESGTHGKGCKGHGCVVQREFTA